MDEEKSDLYNCLKIVICESVGEDKDVIKDFANWLCDNEVITLRHRKKIYNIVKEGLNKEAAELLIQPATEHNLTWGTALSEAVGDEDFPGSKQLKSLLTKLLDGSSVPKHISSLILAWGKLLALKDNALQKIKSTWPSEEEDLSCDWPLTFIVKCQQEYDTEHVEEFLESMKSVLEAEERKEIQNSDEGPISGNATGNKEIKSEETTESNETEIDKNKLKIDQNENDDQSVKREADNVETEINSEETTESSETETNKKKLKIDQNEDVDQSVKREADNVETEIKSGATTESNETEIDNKKLKIDQNEDVDQSVKREADNVETEIKPEETTESNETEIDKNKLKIDQIEDVDQSVKREADNVETEIKSEETTESNETEIDKKKLKTDQNEDVDQSVKREADNVETEINSEETTETNETEIDKKKLKIDQNENDDQSVKREADNVETEINSEETTESSETETDKKKLKIDQNEDVDQSVKREADNVETEINSEEKTESSETETDKKKLKIDQNEDVDQSVKREADNVETEINSEETTETNETEIDKKKLKIDQNENDDQSVKREADNVETEINSEETTESSETETDKKKLKIDQNEDVDQSVKREADNVETEINSEEKTESSETETDKKKLKIDQNEDVDQSVKREADNVETEINSEETTETNETEIDKKKLKIDQNENDDQSVKREADNVETEINSKETTESSETETNKKKLKIDQNEDVDQSVKREADNVETEINSEEKTESSETETDKKKLKIDQNEYVDQSVKREADNVKTVSNIGDSGKKRAKSSGINIKSSEELKNQTGKHIEVEFRVVLADGSNIPPNYILCMDTNLYGDQTSIEMEKHASEKYFFCVIPALKNKKTVEYKYHLYSRLYEKTKWEEFTQIGRNFSKRKIHGLSAGFVYQDVAAFDCNDSSKSWDMSNNDTFIQHLPGAEVLVLKREQVTGRTIDFFREVLTWMRNAKKGWTITYPCGYIRKPASKDIEAALRKWLESNAKFATNGGEMNIIRVIVSTVALAIAIHHKNIVILKQNFLRDLFKMLSIQRLNAEYQKVLYDEIVALCEAHDKRIKADLQNAILSLFQKLPDFPVAEFLLALPLYWLISNAGCVGISPGKKMMKKDLMLYKRSVLPSGKNLDWPKIRHKCCGEQVQRVFLELAKDIHEIYQTLPWITGSYHCMLSAKSLISLIEGREKNMIGDKFALDSIFDHLLIVCKPSRQTRVVEISDLIELSGFFICSFQDLLEEIKIYQDAGVSEEEVDSEKMELAVNILTSFQIFFDDFASNSISPKQTKICNDEVLWCLGMTSNAAEIAFALKSRTSEKILNKVFNCLDNILKSIICRINKDTIDEDQLNYWSSLMTMRWNIPSFEDNWRQKVKDEMKKKINKTYKDKDEMFLDFYAATLEKVKLQEDVEACFSQKAFACTESLLSRYASVTEESKWSWKYIYEWFNSPCFVQIFDKLFNREFDKISDDSQEVIPLDMKILRFLFSWSFAPQFFRLFCTEENLSSFSHSTKEKISIVSGSFQSIVSSLESGQILVKHLKFILKNTEKFFEVRKAIQSTDTSVDKKDGCLTQLMEKRKLQLRSFEAVQDHVRGFLHACAQLEKSSGGDLKVEYTVLKNTLNLDVESEMLSMISSDTVRPESLFGLTPDTLEHLSFINFIKGSKVFQRFWHDNAVQVNETSDHGSLLISWKKVLELIWDPTKTTLIKSVQRLNKGTLPLKTASEWFCCCDGSQIAEEVKLLYECYDLIFKKKEKPFRIKILKDSQERMKSSDDAKTQDFSDGQDQDREPQHQYFSLKYMDRRIRQMCNYFELQNAKETIHILLLLKNELELEGDFSSIEKQRKNLDKDASILNDISENRTLPLFCKIPQDEVNVLKLFIKERELILWLKEKMANINEVKVMCDLAMISAGESPYEVDIVSCLLSSVMGFSPLIFELDKTAGYEKLLDSCKAVWKNRDKDVNLLQKWKDAGNQLAWFKRIENFHGSIEKQSQTLAREFNERGIYTIQLYDKLKMPSAKNCIELILPDKVDPEKKVVYPLDELCDLQSKLMLIAGEADSGKTDVTLYVEVLTAVQILARTFVKLVSVGCMLFNNWSVVIICQDVSSDKVNNLLIQIKFADDALPFSSTGTIADLTTLSTILNKSFERWSDYISLQRMKHYFLNEFDIQQLIYLCHELAICENRLSLPDQVTTLLSCINPNINIDGVHAALDKATKITDEDSLETLGMPDMMEEESTDFDEIEQKKKTVRNLIEANIEENIAKAAVQFEGYEDVEKCITWVLLNQYQTDQIEKLCKEFDQKAGFAHQEKKVCVVKSVLHNRAENTLKDVIDRLQVAFRSEDNSVSLMDLVNTVCVGYHDETKNISLKDYLSIEHLGRFLRLLHETGVQQQNPICRELMEPLQTGRPNLGICSEQEILLTTLSLYMGNEEQSLPTPSEVLVCTDQTSVDEVERFMRRAMCKCNNLGQLLFVLAFADKLSFNVSTATEKIYGKLSQDRRMNSNYQLVILLSNQQHYLKSCFDKYLIEVKCVSSIHDISKYLEKHLKVTDVKNSAAYVDKNHSMVRIVTSTRSGVGKSLHIRRLFEQLDKHLASLPIQSRKKTIRLLEKTIDNDYVIERLYGQTVSDSCNRDTMLIHIDLTPAVQQGIETFAFNLFVLGSISDSHGKIWKRHPDHLYMIEMTDSGSLEKGRFSNRHILNLLPSIRCIPPREVLTHSVTSKENEWLGMDHREFLSESFQRPYQYLKRYEDKTDLDSFVYTTPMGDSLACIRVLLKHCCMNNPSWAQLRYFAEFLNVQLQNCEKSIFCDQSIVGDELPGLKAFAVKFMIRMAQDFATPSLDISDESSADYEQVYVGLESYQIRRKWEESMHPYLFFNEDGNTMTFINVNISDNGDLLDKNGDIVEPKIISKSLVAGLKRQNVSLDLNFNKLTRDQKLSILCLVMGIQQVFDPDPTYELTPDNILKILAIYMRFRCQIPVIIMGETGCGKTRMIEFMSRLKAGLGKKQMRSMITLKIHGGVSVSDIYASVREACDIAVQNIAQSGISTILFFDEANTTEAIYAIKEVMCDLTIDGDGDAFQDSQLQLVAACNPYKQLSKETIKKSENAGLGYRNCTSDTTQLFGNIPMRTLVYRVVALPPSMQPFVWDFGQLSDETEGIYIEQMTKKLAAKLNLDQTTMKPVNAIFSAAQNYMRGRQDECRYVSLRDVERCVIAYEWFYNHKDLLYPLINKEIARRYQHMKKKAPIVKTEIRTLLLTIGVCYHASLDDRVKFREEIHCAFECEEIQISAQDILEEITTAQTVFLQNIEKDDSIVANEALQENVFMMTVCADMRIPLFLIGKPGSSKSLAKTIVGDNMQGATSKSELYRNLKQVHILSYQCSALTDASGIETVFKQCAQLQARQDITLYSAVVVLDEIGLAEDSPNMPLKVLHPLLECGSTTNSSLTEYDITKKVGFVGISNWALDPAKMNRGIFVTRNKPHKDDLMKTAKGIFDNQKYEIKKRPTLLNLLTDAYLEIYDNQEVEYFGLRDYYSLIKMICSTSTRALLAHERVAYAIHRNFSGGEISHFEVFKNKICQLYKPKMLQTSIPICKMISENLQETESRFLLLLTNQFSAASLLNLCIKDFEDNVQVVFGSSFPEDHSYTDICRNINRIKVCMETGKTVVLLNMTEIHESLYDALNQHYVTLGGRKYVDLGLGGHRVKCRNAEEFRLIVIEQEDVVYKKYPIPLINRLEKHHFNARSLLSEDQEKAAEALQSWANDFTSIKTGDFGKKDAFVGYHKDTLCSIVLTSKSEDEEKHKCILLQSTAMDAIFRLPKSEIGGETETVQKKYLFEQCHDSLLVLLKNALDSNKSISLYEIVSYSNILSNDDRQEIESEVGVEDRVMLLSLQQFETEQEYMSKLDAFFAPRHNSGGEPNVSVLLIQCAQAQSNGPLIECAKHCLENKMKQLGKVKSGRKICVAFLLSTERECDSKIIKKHSLLLQNVCNSQIVYIDELRPTNKDLAAASHFYRKSLCEILQMGLDELEIEGRNKSPINILSLLRDCVCEAVKQVSPLSENERNLERIKILTKFCTQKTGVGIRFCKVLLQKMIQLYSEEKKQGVNWFVEEACNRDSLLEGGTFRMTLWLCLRRHISRLMAYMISIVDKHDNLNLLSNVEKSSWKIDMWLEIFHAMPVAWSAIEGVQDFHIAGLQHHKSTIACHVPFSYELHDFFNDQWNLSNKQQLSDKDGVFYSLFRQSPLFEICARALGHAEVSNMMEIYTSDLTNTMYILGSDKLEEFEIVKRIVQQQSMKKLMVICSNSEFKDGDQIAMIFLTYKKLEKYLKILSDIFRACPDTLNQGENWIEKQDQTELFSIHIYAFESILQILRDKAENLNDPDHCIEWGNLMTALKRIFNETMNCINDVEAKRRIMLKWPSVALVDLFLEQLLPRTNQTDQFKRYLTVIAPQAKLLWRSLVSANVRGYDTLRILSNVLRITFDDIRLKLLISWQDKKCRYCSKSVKDPTFLPCGHFNCESCLVKLKQATQAGRRCPTCSNLIPENHVLQPATLNPEQLKELENYKSNCTSFFIEYLQQFCFFLFEGSQEPITPMEKQVKVLVKELVVQVPEESLIVASSALDLNINVKSNILRILLNHSYELVIEELKNWLGQLNRNRLEELVPVIITCFEHENWIESSSFGKDRIAALKHLEDKLESAWDKKITGALTKVETLKIVADIRSAITEAASCIQDIFQQKDMNGKATACTNNFITFVVEKITNDNSEPILQEFIVKVACRLYGTEWFHQLKENKSLQVVVPDSLREVGNNNKIDQWSLIGKSYTDANTLLNQSSTTNLPTLVNKMLQPGTMLERLGRILSIFTWSHEKDSKVQKIVTKCLKKNPGAGTYIFKFLIKVRSHFLPVLRRVQNITNQQVYTLYQLVSLVVAMVTSKSHMMGNFLHILTRPSVVANMFLPGMPEDTYFSVSQEYLSEPIGEAKCFDCGTAIGGKKHRPTAGNSRQQMMDESNQAGYLLNRIQGNFNDPSDRLTNQAAAVLHFLLHTCMLSGLDHEEGAILRMLGLRNKQMAQTYLINAMLQNLQSMSDALARNMDDTILVLYSIILRLLNQGQGQHPPDWSTLEKRREWETMFRNLYLLPIFQDLDQVIMRARNQIFEASDQRSLILYRTVYEADKRPEPTTKDFGWNDPMLWKTIEHLSSGRLLQYFGDATEVQEGVMKVILNTPDLHIVKYLEPVLQLQSALIRKYQNNVDMNDTEKIELREFMEDGGLSYQEQAEKYIFIWNETFQKLKAKHSREKRLQDYFERVSMNSPISMFLPSTRGQGQCAKLFAEHLIDIQNNFLTKCKQVMKSDQSIEDSDVPNMFHSHFVCIDKQKDLLPLIHLHTRYVIMIDDQGRHHQFSFNIDAIEKQTRKQFIMYKKLIAKQTLPCIQYPLDIGIGPDWNKVLANTQQVRLSTKIIQEVDKIVLRVPFADVCEGVRTLAQAISFLAQIKSEGNRSLYDFLEKDLLLPASRMSVILKSVRINHTLSLYNRLSWHKAVRFFYQGLSPYKAALSTVEQVKITDKDVLDKLMDVLERLDVILLQQRLNEMLIKSLDFKGDSRLKAIFPTIDFIGVNGKDDSWYAKLPDELFFKHVADLFAITVQITNTENS